ncbi:MAG: ferrous iron transport protein B [Candidatus Krumholzibacteria bacterium]|nr:ferrous iron transport protein B [Candidatus Krumholzibacteria bacterium]
MKADDKNKSKILLVGNPNVGKSVIFSYLTGKYVVVSNYPGTTVEVSTGHYGSKSGPEVVDTPGVNSLFPASEDERVTRDIVFANLDATVVQVVDAKNIYRALMLTTQLAEAGCRIVLVLNMMDEARQRGIRIDTAALSETLGVEVIETVAVEKRGLSRLSSLIDAGEARLPSVGIRYSKTIEQSITESVADVDGLEKYGRFGILSHILGDDDFFREDKSIDQKALLTSSKNREVQAEKYSEHLSYIIAKTRKRSVDMIFESVVRKDGKLLKAGAGWLRRFYPAIILAAMAGVLDLIYSTATLSEAGLYPTLYILALFVFAMALTGKKRMDRITLHPVYGLGVLILIIYMIYKLVGVFAAGTLVDLIETGVFAKIILPALEKIAGDGFTADLLLGEYGLISMGLSYSISIVLPIVVVFFLVFGILEDTGYFPRLTVLTNNVFKFVGVNGKATLPIVLGFGCVTMAILASRILETKRERIIVITLLALAIPCSAQLGVMLALMSAISTGAVITISLIVLGEFFIVGHILGRYLKGARSDFILDLPPLRVPRVYNIAIKTGARARWFLVEAVPYFMLATLILFTLERTGAMVFVYRAVEPVVGRLLGLPIETASVFIIGFFRRDYGAAGLFRMWQEGLLTGNQIAVALTVMSLFLPCLASLIVMIKEVGTKYALVIFFFVLFLSLMSGGALNLFLGLTRITF